MDESGIFNSDQRSFYHGKRSLIRPVIEQKQCSICKEYFDIDVYDEHAIYCNRSENTSPIILINQSEVYYDSIDVTTNEDSDDEFRTPTNSLPIISDEILPIEPEKSQKLCPLCFNMIEETEFVHHVSHCLSPITDSCSTKECVICFKPIKESEFEEHVRTCLSDDTLLEISNKKTVTCYSCYSLINIEDNLSREISCPSHHIYCLSCLHKSMEKYIQNKSTPLCHPTLCNYELSRYDISTIPLQRRISDQLIKLAKGKQRPQCSKCHFYININEIDDFYEHVDNCQDILPCEYCFCPYSTDQLGNHSKQCQNDRSSLDEKLTNFIIDKTKYPLTKEQIYTFIQQKKKESQVDLDPLSIINSLEDLGPNFPDNTPTRGIIRCPNLDCTWTMETDYPNESFIVQCQSCKREFCSFCTEQYHYETRCEQLLELTQQWLFWCEEGRNRYLTVHDQLDDYDRNKELRCRYELLIHDEEWKQQNCCLCPSCNRVVQRMDGCNSIVCGQGYAGHNASGCGTRFIWSQALPYTAARIVHPEELFIDLPKPENPIIRHIDVQCDECGNEVNGIRFDCIHCRSLTYCEKCEAQATLNHFRQNQHKKQQQHIFRLIMKSK